ncbi:hypothetical protein T02_7254 [Trichinella nativa]|uniref:C2H2-type domain-containing protein n=1 Tax=Trichinella nativa TaxID=6335 RepID=A0A0V1L0X7_9BILA|nr:hypothetical protein T02_7254 [Trichinella nativa]
MSLWSTSNASTDPRGSVHTTVPLGSLLHATSLTTTDRPSDCDGTARCLGVRRLFQVRTEGGEYFVQSVHGPMSTAGSNGQTMDFKNASWSSGRETSLTSSLTIRCSSTTEINSDSDATLNGFEESTSIPTCTLPRVLDCQSCRSGFDFTDKQHQHYHHLHQHHQPQKQQQQQQQQQQISRSCNLTPKPNGGLIHSIRRLFKLSTNADIKTHWQFHSLGKLPSSTLHTADCNTRSRFKQKNPTDGHQTITTFRIPTKEKPISLKAISLSTHSEATFLNQSSTHVGGDQFDNNSLFKAVDDQQSKTAWNNANPRRASNGYGRLASNFKRTETAIDKSRLCNSRFPLCSRALSMNYSNQQHCVNSSTSSPLNLSSSTNVVGPVSKRATTCDSGASSSIITEIMQTPSVENSMMCQSTIGYICQNVPKRANLWWRRHGRCGANSKITWDNICIKSEQPSLVSRIATYYEASIQIGASEDVDVTVMIVALTHKNPIPKTRRLPFTLPYVFQIAEDIECRLLLNLNQGDRNYEEEEEQDDNDDVEEADENEESVQNMRIPCTVYILPKSSVYSLSAAVKNQLDTIVKQESKDLTFLCKFKREICFLMTQLITVFKYLQSIGVEYATKEIEELVLLKIDSEDKPRLILEWDFVSIEERLFKDWQVEKCSLCKVASRILLAVIRTVSGMTCEDADEKRKNLNCVIDHAILKAAHVLIEEKADSLTRALCLMQYIVWVLPEKSLKPLLCEEQANEWIQSERTRLLCHLVKKLLNPLYEINVYDHYCLLFLLNASPKYLLYAEKLICETN